MKIQKRRMRQSAGWLMLGSLLLSERMVTAMESVESIPAPMMYEDFRTLEGWKTGKAPGTELTLSIAPGMKDKSLRMEYDFAGTQAYVLASKPVRLKLPENFEFSFHINRTEPGNSFEFKLIDAAGNTFMKKWYSFASV